MLSRRDWLLSAGAGFGGLALNALHAADNPLAAKKPHFAAKAKRVIFVFLEGGPSHLDTFDPKPQLNKLAGKPIPDSFGSVILPMGESRSPLLASKRKWAKYGKSGLPVSDWLPHIAAHADDLAVIRSCMADGINHSAGVCQMNSGSILGGRPSLGAWVSYGLGTVNANLPAFVVMQDNPSSVVNGPRNWSAGFMPAVYQGTRIQGGAEPIPNLNTPEAEAAAAFDDLTRAGISEGFGALWPIPFREGQFVTAVDYLRANRLRTLLMNEMAKLMDTVDLYVGGNDLQITNHTGHPTVCLPCGFTERKAGNLPQAVTFTGRLFGETELLTVAKAYQDATDFHTKRPPMENVTKENAEGK